ncbi:hypothetical protein IWQ47_001587 [Aquimarina sp. EL_43]|uniref:hypothetical protein n=1 Tax=unclassified Aquimarina TaxID=2627091 RepID=UPI0018CA12A4|nr:MULTISPECIES: hypothetical protein [unclassified Aquimarina]MBG6130330.1 hypothetical protein [Aquimarina sp. EL_35]MBG6149110.1 hypothetical protein [Aquimarina sp. EL_32]MBG6168516.1 hypothetical protein [Aquimarina sp. EL_43]
MKIVGLIYLSALLLFLNCRAQSTNSKNKILHTFFKVIDADSHTEVPIAVIVINSGNKRIDVIDTDYDGIGIWEVCSKKIVNHNIKISVFGMNYKPFEKSYTITTDTKLTIELKSGKGKFKNREEREYFLRRELGVPFCNDALIDDKELEEIETLENAIYQHYCDGRIKRFNDIPAKELHHWKKIERQSTKKAKDEN